MTRDRDRETASDLGDPSSERKPTKTLPRRQPFRGVRRLLRALQTAWSIVGITLALFLLLEGAVYVLTHESPASASQRKADRIRPHLDEETRSDAVQFFHETMGDGVLEPRWEPFSYFRTAEFHGRYVNVDADGLRRTWNPSTSRPSGAAPPPTIFIFGGSSVFGFGARDDKTVPSWLSRILDQRGHAAVVWNFGQNGYVSTQEVIALARELQRGNVPDVVIFLDGFNDIFSALWSQTPGETFSEQRRRIEFNMTNTRVVPRCLEQCANQTFAYKLTHLRDAPEPTNPNSIIRGAATAMWKDYAESLFKRPDVRQRYAETLNERSVTDDEEKHHVAREIVLDIWAEQIVSHYVANLRFAEALAHEYGFQCVFYMQPLMSMKKNPSPAEQEAIHLFREWRMYTEPVYRKIRADQDDQVDPSRPMVAFHRVGDFFDDSSSSASFTFIDFCHPTESANPQIANCIANDLIRGNSLLGRSSSRH